LSIDTGVFPDSLKKAQVTPLHKKNDPLSKTNYRPVSVLPVFSKIFEKDKKGLNIVSKKSDNCVSNTFSKILEKTGRTLTGL
jgi:hypothetical protein